MPFCEIATIPPMPAPEPIYLLDGSAYIHRAYHALPPLSNSSGLPTHAVLGFTNILLRVIREKSPRYLAVAFDAKGPNHRHALFPDYKANRPRMQDDLAVQIPWIKHITAAYRIPVLEREGCEADDLLASAATLLKQAGHPVVLVSGDKDLLQLVNDRTIFWDPMNDRLFDRAGVAAKYGLGPERLTDFFALIGDTSDNIPGVPGIGPKTAAKLLSDFGSLEGIYDRLGEIKKPKLHENLATGKDKAFLARELVRLREDLEVPPDLEGYRLPAPDTEKLRELYTFLEFSRLLKTEVPAQPLCPDGFRLADTEEKLAAMVARLRSAPFLVLDTETNSLNPLAADLVGLAFCVDEQEAFYVPILHKGEDGGRCDGQLTNGCALAALRPLLEDPQLPKVGHNLKFDYHVLCNQGVRLAGPLWDTMIASYLLDPSRRSHGLDDLCEEILQRRLTSFAEVTGKDKREGPFAYVRIDKARDYACEDVAATLLLWRQFRPRLEALGLWGLFTELELPLLPILARMERDGVKVDPEVLRGMSAELDAQLANLEEEIFRQAGEEFNISSPRQLGVILFEKLKLPQGRKTKTGYSTDFKVLEQLCLYHELPAVIIAHRNLSKLKSTYVDKLPTLIDPRSGRVHTSFNQTVAATGRLSSSEPNLQNIPVRTREGQRIREAFVPDAGHLFLAADYSQIDLRVLAHYSRDEALVAAFQAGKDVHQQTAGEIFRVNPMLITPEMRRVAKTINFGIVYGMSAFGLATQLNISRKEARTFIDRYFALFAGVRRYMEEIVRQAQTDGFVTTLFHRRRPLPDINSPNRISRELAERTAINTPIQGTAADIIKLAMLRVDEQLRRQGLRSRLLLQIHDELILEVPEAEVAPATALVREAMEGAFALAVPLVVNIGVGRNLAEV
ncbi:MAG: DNA polymerase I [Desulfobacteraceae bacterium]|nr:DNA polymerase I [Desulfobacteraceae bacterium]